MAHCRMIHRSMTHRRVLCGQLFCGIGRSGTGKRMGLRAQGNLRPMPGGRRNHQSRRDERLHCKRRHSEHHQRA
jgi:hypothetical protein